MFRVEHSQTSRTISRQLADGKHLEAGRKLSSEWPEIFRWYCGRRSERLNAEYTYMDPGRGFRSKWCRPGQFEYRRHIRRRESVLTAQDGLENIHTLRLSGLWVISLDLLEIPVKTVFGKSPHQYKSSVVNTNDWSIVSSAIDKADIFFQVRLHWRMRELWCGPLRNWEALRCGVSTGGSQTKFDRYRDGSRHAL